MDTIRLKIGVRLMTLFDLSEYNLRQLDPKQGTKPLDFGGGGITGSVNLDGRFIAINTYHPEHGYITLTSIPPFPDEDRYDQQKVRAYRKSLVNNEGFGLMFEQEIIKREYFLIEDAIPFMRFTLADDTIAECITLNIENFVTQMWRFSKSDIAITTLGKIWLQRVAYTQLTEGGVISPPSNETNFTQVDGNDLIIYNEVLNSNFYLENYPIHTKNHDSSVGGVAKVDIKNSELILSFSYGRDFRSNNTNFNVAVYLDDIKAKNYQHDNLVISRSLHYGDMCQLADGCMITDHMILPLLWTRDSYYVANNLAQFSKKNSIQSDASRAHIEWIFRVTWRGTFCKSIRKPLASAWGRAYMANGMVKDNKAFQLDQQIFPFLELSEYVLETGDIGYARNFIHDVEQLFVMLDRIIHPEWGIYPTDETPADDDIPLHYHFSTHILLWRMMKKIKLVYGAKFSEQCQKIINCLENAVPKYFITEHKGKQIYSYATDGEGKHYIYHDANDIPLVMMPLWGFCEKDDPIWLNTIEFAFSSENSGFYDGVLGSVHTPAPWALGDAQELILSKVLGDRERYQRVWERVEKAAQWDGALPEAYDATTFEVVSRHWFAWTNAMVAIADSISWEWETEGEYAR